MSPVRVDQELGRVPFKALLFRTRLERFDIVDQELGRVPFKALLFRTRLERLVKVDHDRGSDLCGLRLALDPHIVQQVRIHSPYK